MKNLPSQAGQSRRQILQVAALSAVGAALSGRAGAAVGGVSGPLRSAGALAFGPDNVLFVGDITGAAVHAFAATTGFKTASGCRA